MTKISDELILLQAAKKLLDLKFLGTETIKKSIDDAAKALKESEWQVISFREATEEEKEEMDDPQGIVYNSKMPEDGEEVLVTTRWRDVCTDVFIYEAGWCGFVFHDEPGDVIAWRRKPDPYEEENDK